jgi:putative transposase
MKGPKPPAIILSDAERQALETLIKAHSTPQQLVPRARIILTASAGLNNEQVAREVHVSVDMARQWRDRWLLLQPIPLADLTVEERLQDRYRSGKPSQITVDQMCQITALACEKPEASERPISHWSAREIADEIMKRGIVASISPRHAARLLKRSGSETPSDSLWADAGARRTVGRQSRGHQRPVPPGTRPGRTRRTDAQHR